MDERRKDRAAYQYLCASEEARRYGDLTVPHPESFRFRAECTHRRLRHFWASLPSNHTQSYVLTPPLEPTFAYADNDCSWMAEVTGSEMPPVTTFITQLRNGVVLAKLAKKFDFSSGTQQQKIYDAEQTIYQVWH